ncbi:sensor domain-containing diguanylate cyclase [Novosphingobium terrae]|uniref:sensor domain-containing diguanylate cyclase n=1 Tax=Novosphingobium terrae TaxID=2726189 RepID=UPI001981A30E|nr:sensor domain-containing diguanylate cyclase [Novosphingobium terrae]
MSVSPRSSASFPLFKALFAAGAYFLCTAIALQLTRFDGGVAIVWLAGAVLFSLLSITPRRRWWPLLLACLPAGIASIGLFGFGGWLTLPLAVIGVAEAWSAAWLMKRVHPRFGRFESVTEALRFIVVVGLLVPAVSALAGAVCAHLAKGIPYGSAWRDWFTAHALGFVVFSPPLLLALRGQIGGWLRSVRRPQALEATGLLGAVTLCAAITFGQDVVPLVVLPIVPMVAATFRLGRFGAVASVVILLTVGLGCSLAGLGPTMLLHATMTLRLEVLQIYFASVVVILLPLAGELEARQHLLRQVRAADALHRLIIERTSDVMMRLGADGTIRYVSPAALREWGYRPEDLVSRCAYDIVLAADLPAVVEARHRTLENSEQTISVEYRLIRKDGTAVWVESHMCGAPGADGQPNGTISIIRDTTRRRMAMDELERQAMTDPLTGLANRRAFDSALETAVTSHRGGCLALFDLDHFKLINDRYGHATGDRVLTLFAAVLHGTTAHDESAGHVVARLGGEEFAVLFRGASLDQARLLCERVRLRLAASESRSLTGEVVSVTVSVGLAPLVPGETAEQILRDADAALYRAKDGGRNRLTIAA